MTTSMSPPALFYVSASAVRHLFLEKLGDRLGCYRFWYKVLCFSCACRNADTAALFIRRALEKKYEPVRRSSIISRAFHSGTEGSAVISSP
jgi:hypothetical protein